MGRLIPAGTGSLHYRYLESTLPGTESDRVEDDVAEATNA